MKKDFNFVVVGNFEETDSLVDALESNLPEFAVFQGEDFLQFRATEDWQKEHLQSIQEQFPEFPFYSLLSDKNTFYSVKQVAKELKCSTSHIYRLIRDKQLVATKVGEAIRVSRKELDLFLKKNI